MTTSPVVVGQQVRWHRFVECDDEQIVDRIAELTSGAAAHGHEFYVMRSFYDAHEEAERARKRAETIRAEGHSSFVAAGFAERHLFQPIMTIGLFEGEVIDVVENGLVAGIRVVFLGSRARFEDMPLVLSSAVDLNAPLCGCSGGF